MENLTNEEKDYYELLADMLDDGIIDGSERNILNKRKEKYGISDERAKEIEDFAKQEYLESKTPQFETDGEKDYYDLLVDMLDDGVIDESERNILNKRKEKYGISDERAKELENFAKDMNTQNKICKGINTTNNNLDNIESEQKEYNDLYEQGNYHYDNEEYDKAIEIFKKAVELNHDNEFNWQWLGSSYNQNGQYQEAINSLLKAVELNPDDEFNWYWLGRSYNDNEQYQDAINSGLKATQLNPDYADNWLELGCSYCNNGQYQEAINSLLKAVELNPDSDSNWHWLGISYYENDQYQEAIEPLLKAIELNPNDAGLYILGDVYRINGQYEEAIKYLSKEKELNPDGFYSWYELGEAYLNNGQFQEAIETLLKAVELNPNNFESWHSLGWAYCNVGEYVASIGAFIEEAKLNYNANAFYGIGYNFKYVNQYKEAIDAFTTAVELEPDNWLYWDELGKSYYLNEQYEEAVECFEKSIEIGNFNSKYDLANAYLFLEDYDNAIDSYEKCIDDINSYDDKISSYIWNNYGVALANLERTEEARNAYANAVRIDPDSEIARDNLNNIGYSRRGSNNSGIVSGISSTIDAVNEVIKK